MLPPPGASSDAPEASAALCGAASDVTASVTGGSDAKATHKSAPGQEDGADATEKGAASAIDMLDAAVAGKVAKKVIAKKGKVAGMKRPAAAFAMVDGKPDMRDVIVEIKRQRKDLSRNTASSRAYDTARRRCLSLGWNEVDTKKFASSQYQIVGKLYA